METTSVRRRSHSSTTFFTTENSPRSSPTSTPSRQPLHERTRSQTNASPTRRIPTADAKIYRETPFPKLSSQIFPPKSGPYIFQDSNARITSPSIPARSPHRPITPTSTSESSDKQEARLMNTSPVPELPPLRPVSRSKGKARQESGQTFEDIFGPGVTTSRSGSQRSILRKAAPNQKSSKTPPSSSAATFATRRRRQNAKSKETNVSVPQHSWLDTSAVTPLDTNKTVPEREGTGKSQAASTGRGLGSAWAGGHPGFSPDTSGSKYKDGVQDEGLSSPLFVSASRAFDDGGLTEERSHEPFDTPSAKPDSKIQHKSLARVRSQSTVGSRKNKSRFEVFPDTPKSQQERPRSASSPETPTEAFIQTLMGSGINVQYPSIRQPSVNSLRSTTSFTRPTYPAPLRLQRKRADSHLGRTASEANEGWTSSSQDARVRPVASKASVISRSTVGTYEEPLAFHQMIADPQRASANWADEVEDVVPELDRGGLWRSRGDYQRPSFSESRPTTEQSSKSGRPGSFYQFLNDSKTAWASVYYRNESRIRLETPPSVTELQPRCILLEDDTPNRSSSDLHSSISPGSAGFPDSLYIRRYRPHSAQQHSLGNPSNATPRASSSLSSMRTIHRSNGPSFDGTTSSITAVHDTRTHVSAPNQHRPAESITALPPITPPHNVTPPLDPIPHLSPDKRHNDRLPRWTAPSLEEPDSRSDFIFSPTNRQIILFCIGFVFPLSWWAASMLPLPRRPRVSSPEIRESGVGQWEQDQADVAVDQSNRPRLGQTVELDVFKQEEVRRYQKARWWRNMNRVMSLVGLAVIAAIIACAVVATR